MILTNYKEFKAGLKAYLDRVENDCDTLFLKRKKGNGVVVMSLEEYNSLMETVHLLKSKKNRKRLKKALLLLPAGSVLMALVMLSLMNM